MRNPFLLKVLVMVLWLNEISKLNLYRDLLLKSTGNGAEEFEKLISFDKSISFTTSGNGAMEL